MNKLEEYILRYQGIHSGSDPFLVGTRETINGQGKVVFDGSQLGKKLPPYIHSLFANRKRAITLLDYGCGKAIHVYQPLKEHGDKTLLGRFEGMIQCYYCYDPAVEIYSTKPPVGMVFDTVCCADVMEHIPEEFVDTVLKEIADYTKEDGTAMFTISGNLAKKSFKDGENLHATIKPVEWWTDKLLAAFGNKAFLMFFNNEAKPNEPIEFRYHNSSDKMWSFPESGTTVGGLPCVAAEV